ncbi:hypothetical protein BU24DRAFT_427579 [Aaosphaeria arxii CBS 175.79]|uniref:Uncharacterized protein n=1 Tax=Aaosphaeria arxii CBS 175.79 TaxID=1450172 RepID=A0A6A5XBK4_9PLEO|nr:uncharacterized protein BU24DRAFT_427579 [Aaosphaeria arxii CBS 175.79]KAF2010455.1 hypothetical protein BU24DRAFT_427579 [Aaosphaeria arxii CBS 175.79]
MPSIRSIIFAGLVAAPYVAAKCYDFKVSMSANINTPDQPEPKQDVQVQVQAFDSATNAELCNGGVMHGNTSITVAEYGCRMFAGNIPNVDVNTIPEKSRIGWNWRLEDQVKLSFCPGDDMASCIDATLVDGDQWACVKSPICEGKANCISKECHGGVIKRCNGIQDA